MANMFDWIEIRARDAEEAAHPETGALSIRQSACLVGGPRTSKSTVKSRCRALNRLTEFC